MRCGGVCSTTSLAMARPKRQRKPSPSGTPGIRPLVSAFVQAIFIRSLLHNDSTPDRSNPKAPWSPNPSLGCGTALDVLQNTGGPHSSPCIHHGGTKSAAWSKGAPSPIAVLCVAPLRVHTVCPKHQPWPTEPHCIRRFDSQCLRCSRVGAARPIRYGHQGLRQIHQLSVYQHPSRSTRLSFTIHKMPPWVIRCHWVTATSLCRSADTSRRRAFCAEAVRMADRPYVRSISVSISALINDPASTICETKTNVCAGKNGLARTNTSKRSPAEHKA